ncbi:MAG TPA: condensation domain-containing protein, partial [Vicinamibacteria bacterium]
LDYIGRRDHQVKIRGFRVELGEIESVLSQHESVSEAVVVARQDRPGTQRLVAYCVPARESSWDAEAVREHLRKRLPEYMVPPSLVSLPALPLTPNGKVDRRALPAPELESKKVFVAPETEAERKIARVWSEVLGVAAAGVHDNFFELGGDSILSIQVVSRLQQEGLLLTPGQVFEHPTIAELARVVESGEAGAADEEAVAGEIPLTPIQRWFFEQEESAPGRYNHCLLLELKDGVEAEHLSASVRALLGHHDALRARFDKKETGWEQRYAGVDEEDGSRSFRRIDLGGLPEEEQRRVIQTAAAEARSSLDLKEGPLLRAVLFARGSAGDRLLLVIHHLVVDGVSWRILLEDLWQGYEQRRLGRPIFFRRKTSSYKKWAQRLWERARSPELREESGWWRVLARSEAIELPRDHEAGRNTAEAAETVTVRLNEEETRLLLQEVPWAYRTQINDVLLTALTQVVGRWTGSGAALLDLEGHGREELFEDVDLSRTVGWFTSLYPVRLELPECGPGEALKSVKEQLRRIPAKGSGYGLLRYQTEDQELARELARLKPQLSFNYLGQLDSALGGLPVKLSAEPVS